MGCDIHMIGESRWHGLKDWHVFPIPEKFQTRNYAFFGELAGVRRLVDYPLSNDRGWPEDMSEISWKWAKEYYEYDNEIENILGMVGDHTPGYACLYEIRQYDWKDTDHSFLLDFIFFLEQWRDDITPEDNQVRIIFNFDN